MFSYEISLLIIERDACLHKAKRLDELILKAGRENSLEQIAVVSEENFNVLNFEPQQGSKIGEFEIAYEERNPPDRWHVAYDILRSTEAKIDSRLVMQGYTYGYWIYGTGRIYRQKVKAKTA